MTWYEIPHHPNYYINVRGEVKNDSDHIMSRSYNQQGIATVYFNYGPKQVARSVAVLVASMFVQQTEDLSDQLPSVIHLDGDRRNCHVNNLQWRSRAVAIRYHKDFRKNVSGMWRDPILLVETEEIFPTPLEAAMAYGIPQSDIRTSVFNQGRVGTAPFSYHFTWATPTNTY